MPILSHEDLKTVVAASQTPAVSIFIPTHRAGPEIQQDPIRLKNLLKQAESHLIAEGSRSAEARELLAPISKLLEDAAFWRHQQDGLAVFRSRDVFKAYKVPLVLPEFVSVSNRFYVQPLLPLLTNDERFYVLALSQKAIRLLECARDYVHEVDIPQVPQGMDAGTSRQLQRHSLPMDGRSAARFHGHGVGTDDVDIVNVTRYFHHVDEGLIDILKHQRAPLILACVEFLAPIYRDVTCYPHVLDAIVSGNPDGMRNEDLHRKSWILIEPHFTQAREQAMTQYHEGLAKRRADHRLAEVLSAAHQGRIAVLFVPIGVQQWGRFDFARLSLEQHPDQQPGDDELLDLASIQTLMHGGIVYAVKPDEIPGKHLLAAVYRF